MNLKTWSRRLINFSCFLFFNCFYYHSIVFITRLLWSKPRLSKPIQVSETIILHTLPYSHYCEKVRWVLSLQNEIYEEKPHGLMTYLIFSLYYSRGNYRKVPLCIMKDGTIIYNSADILGYLFHNQPQKYGWLYPNPETAEIEEYLDTNLGFPIMGLVYPTLLNNSPSLLAWQEGIKRNIPSREGFMFSVAIGTLRMALEVKRGPFQHDFASCLQKVKKVFAQVDELLKNRLFLANTSHLTAADLTFASLSYPILCPEKMNDVYLKLEDFPADFQVIIQEFRKTKAGRFALNLYQKERSKETRIRIANQVV